MHDDLLEPLDSWVSRQSEKPSRSEAIRFILKDWFIAQGLIPYDEDDSTAD
jgi:metal-responsive CopG/Arc/MetJ family transcriptional regulator